ncbi:MAG: hypothetical protein EKK64_01560 [Neisseriaceae bacterium]|nr:MAG: hypothetical protein EKK64_01560 [Neisseriaceae bacterium]
MKIAVSTIYPFWTSVQSVVVFITDERELTSEVVDQCLEHYVRETNKEEDASEALIYLQNHQKDINHNVFVLISMSLMWLD